MSANERIITDLLNKCNYRYKDMTKRDVTGALSYFKDLALKTDKHVYPTGVFKELVCLSGTIPVNFRGNVYNIPVQIFLSETHPYDKPIAYVRPTPDMNINVSDAVDSNGLISLPCLKEWNYQNSDLYMLLNLMAIKFSEQTPLYSKPLRPVSTASASNFGSYPSNNPPYPSNFPINPSYPPPPPANNSSYPSATPYPTSNSPYFPMPPTQYSNLKSNSNSNIASTRQSFANFDQRGAYADETIKPEHYRMSLISAIQDKMRKKFKDACDEKQAEIDSLKRVSSDLVQSESNLKLLISEAENECLNINQLIGELKARTGQLNENVNRMKHRDKTELEDVVVTPTPLYRQMLQLYAEEMAIQDFLFYLSEGLTHKTVNLDNYLKQVRFLSRKQFYLRATLQKARRDRKSVV